ncbi:hypothetical protein BV898_15095 [Hypsibius exemplaris]|uniref:G-protein coupled receptors family 1 profile domain-containing protein n=1 Tax=Hypsibius exemplaris TaxID=2072580 RepID=A0A9X6RK22_HYPEX|nr:hypothetical protein BV898_15095 [Hypsibius exemplaris]
MNETILNSNGTSATWTALPVCLLLACLTGIVGNVVLLAVFILHRRTLWTPFNVYVVNLLIANCLLHCHAPVIFNSHQLIALNRIWAVSHPISYRQIHSKRTAICLCVSVWAYVFIGMSPGVIQDRMNPNYRNSVDGPAGCSLNAQAQSQWALAVQIIFFIWPQFFMAVAMVVIFAAKRTKPRMNVRRSNAVGPSHAPSYDTRNDGEQTDPPTVSANQAHTGQRSAPQQGRPTPSHRSSGSLLLILLTISVTVCWTPNNVFFTWPFTTLPSTLISPYSSTSPSF